MSDTFQWFKEVRQTAFYGSHTTLWELLLWPGMLVPKQATKKKTDVALESLKAHQPGEGTPQKESSPAAGVPSNRLAGGFH